MQGHIQQLSAQKQPRYRPCLGQRISPEEGASARARVDQSNALIILQTVENRHFSSLASASAYLKSLSPEERFEIVNEQASKLVAVQESLSKCFERCVRN
jgi:hypothetical protein